MNRVKLAMLASTALCLSCGLSQAADMPVKARVAPVAVDPWVGWYVGGNIGYSWGRTDTETNVGGFAQLPGFGTFVSPGSASTTRSDVNGVIGGVQAGYVGRISPNWLGGVEADFQGSGQKGDARLLFGGLAIECTSPGCSYANANDITAKLNWFGTFRGRVGPELNGIWFYGTAGFAYGKVSVSGVNTFVASDIGGVVNVFSTPYNYSQVKGGWTAGIGAEGLIGNGPWRWKVEYLHIDLGQVNGGIFAFNPFVQVNTTRFTDEILRVGFNYKFDENRPASTMPVKAPPPALMRWTGWYAGLNAGYIDTIGRTSTDAQVLTVSNVPNAFDIAGSATNQFNHKSSGFIGGGQVGYNYQFSPSFVAGVEADIQGTTLRRDFSGNATTGQGPFWQTSTAVSDRLDYLGTVRARVGVTPTPNLMIYSTGGLAYGGVRSSTAMNFTNTGFADPGSTSGSSSQTRFGWTAGGGFEWMFSPNWTAKLEYLYYDLGTASYATGGYAVNVGPTAFQGFGIESIGTRTSTRFEGNIVRVGVNYKFGG